MRPWAAWNRPRRQELRETEHLVFIFVRQTTSSPEQRAVRSRDRRFVLSQQPLHPAAVQPGKATKLQGGNTPLACLHGVHAGSGNPKRPTDFLLCESKRLPGLPYAGGYNL